MNEVTFPLGQVKITPNAMEQLDQSDVLKSLSRHVRGDWGDCCKEDAETNDLALEEGSRLLSVYFSSKIEFWIITEHDRSATTILLPEDY